MPDEGGNMPDLKTVVLLIALTGGTNVLQYFGVTAPTETAKSEVTANSDFMRDQLKVCLADLKQCYSDCGRPHAEPGPVSNTDLGVHREWAEVPDEWEAAVPYPAQMVR
jgi:hypothetical protein